MYLNSFAHKDKALRGNELKEKYKDTYLVLNTPLTGPTNKCVKTVHRTYGTIGFDGKIKAICGIKMLPNKISRIEDLGDHKICTQCHRMSNTGEWGGWRCEARSVFIVSLKEKLSSLIKIQRKYGKVFHYSIVNTPGAYAAVCGSTATSSSFSEDITATATLCKFCQNFVDKVEKEYKKLAQSGQLNV